MARKNVHATMANVRYLVEKITVHAVGEADAKLRESVVMRVSDLFTVICKSLGYSGAIAALACPDKQRLPREVVKEFEELKRIAYGNRPKPVYREAPAIVAH
jgi:hypothetical protein